jgi:hypothetical protein
MVLRLHAGQPIRLMIRRPALTHDGTLTTNSADAGERICFSRTALCCSAFFLAALLGT